MAVKKSMKIRIVERYSPVVGTWYVLQKRIFFFWVDSPYAFADFKMAKQMFDSGYEDGYMQHVITNHNDCFDSRHYRTTTRWEPSWLRRLF